VDLLVLSEVRWGYFRTRKQFLLSRFPERWRIFFAQPPAFGGDDPWTPRREGNVTYFTVPFLKPGTRQAAYNAVAETALGRTTIEGIAEAALRRRIQRLGIERSPVVMVSNIYCPGALARLEKRACFYDYNDNPFQFSSTPTWAAPYWEQTVAQADAVFVVSEYYRRRLAETLKQPLIPLGNGVEYDRFASPRPVPPDLVSSPRPWIGYLGLLSHFLDFETLEALRENRRGGTLVLIGPGSPATEARLAELAARPGVVRLGPKPYEEVPAYLQALDVGVIPFRAQDPYVQGINPNKVYQFLASGCPVVTTPLMDLDQVPPSLQFAETAIEMVQAAHRALDHRPAVEACRALARPHDWGGLAARMVTEIERRLS